MQSNSEMPFIVDFSTRCIYCNYDPLDENEIKQRPVVFSEGGDVRWNYYMAERYIPFEMLDISRIKEENKDWIRKAHEYYLVKLKELNDFIKRPHYNELYSEDKQKRADCFVCCSL